MKSKNRFGESRINNLSLISLMRGRRRRVDRLSHPIGVARLWGTGARALPRLTQLIIFQCTLTCTKSDSDYMSTVPPVKPSNFCMCPSWHQILATPLPTPLLPECIFVFDADPVHLRGLGVDRLSLLGSLELLECAYNLGWILSV